FAGKPQKDAQTYMQHLALRTTDIEKLKSYLESKGAEFLTPIYKDKDSFGPLLQSFTRELFDDEWFFIEFVQRDYDADKLGVGGTQFVQNTVKSLYVSKQEEFREWEKPGKKRTVLDSDPDKEEIRKLTGDWSLNKLLTKYVGLDSDSQLVCPNCGGLMEIEDAGNVRVDACLDCKGVWLDAGELERLAAMDPAEFRTLTPEK